MKTRVFGILQRIGRSFMLPIAVLPIAGLFLGIGSSLTNETTISSLHLEGVLGNGTFLHDFLIILTKVGSGLFNNLPLIFAAAVALGMAKKAKEVAVLSSIIAFFVMHTTISGMLSLNGSILDNQIINPDVLDGTITAVCGIMSLEMGVFGGIIVGLGVSYIHNRFYQIELPRALSFFEGERFIPIISTITFLFVGIVMFYVWPFFQNGIYELGKLISTSGYFGTFVYGVIKRLLVPFGLHHVFYLPFWQTAIGGSMVVNGAVIYGGQNIFFAQLADPNIVHFSSEATKYFTGEFIFMIFGLPGAALAMIHTAKDNKKKVAIGLVASAAVSAFVCGVTEPFEFAFMFLAPVLYVIYALLYGIFAFITVSLGFRAGFSFSAGATDLLFSASLPAAAKTWLIVPLGIAAFIVFYVVFRFAIVKFDLKTPGREDDDEDETKVQLANDDFTTVAQIILEGVGGKENVASIDNCITRLRLEIKDYTAVDEKKIKSAGVAGVIRPGKNSVQVIIGTKVQFVADEFKKLCK